MLHGLIGFRRRPNWTHLFLACCCLSAGVYAIGGIEAYRSDSSEAFTAALRFQISVAHVFWIFFCWFVASLSRRGWRIPIALTFVHLGMIGVNQAMPFTYFYSQLGTVDQHVLPWGEAVTWAPNAVVSAWGAVGWLTAMISVTYGLVQSRRCVQQGQRAVGAGLFIGLCVFLATMVHDILLDYGVVSFIYLAEFGFLTVVLIMSVELSIGLERARTQAREAQAFLETANAALGREIEARTRAQRSKQLLLEELDHRYRNSLQGILSYLAMSANHSDDPDPLRSFEGRVRAMAETHRILSSSSEEPVTLDHLISTILKSIEMLPDNALSVSGRTDITIPPRTVTRFGMTLHELMTNAMKHGVLRAPGGRIGIDIEERVDGSIVMRWDETGGAPARVDRQGGCGTHLIEGFIGDDLGGTVQFIPMEDGLRCVLVLPAAARFAHRGGIDTDSRIFSMA